MPFVWTKSKVPVTTSRCPPHPIRRSSCSGSSVICSRADVEGATAIGGANPGGLNHSPSVIRGLGFSRGERTSHANAFNKRILLFLHLDISPCMISHHHYPADVHREMRGDANSRLQGKHCHQSVRGCTWYLTNRGEDLPLLSRSTLLFMFYVSCFVCLDFALCTHFGRQTAKWVRKYLMSRKNCLVRISTSVCLLSAQKNKPRVVKMIE